MLINPIKRFVAKVFGRLPLRTVFIVPFVLQISTAVGIVGYLSFINGQRAVYELSTQLQRQISWRIYLHLDTYLRMPQLLNQSNENTLQQGLLKPSSLPELESFFLRQMRAFDLVPYTAWGNEKGEYIGIDRQRDGTLHVEVVDDPTHPKFYTYDVNPQGQRGKLLQITPFYDPRTRPWYQNAMAQRKATWSSIYVWFNQTEMAIDATLPVYDSNGTLLGVFDTPLKLSRISDYLRQLKISPSGQSFIIERSGLLVASSHEAKPFIMGNDNQPHRLNAADSKNPLIQSTARYLIQRFGNLNQVDTPTQIAFLNNHQRQFVQVVPFQDGRGIDWLIIVVIPEADFMAQINANTRTTLMLCIATVVLATVIGNLTSSWVIQPISHLNAAASNIARGEWDKRVELEHADELGDLAHSFNSMAEKIQTSMAEMKALNEVLAQQEHRLTHYLEALPMGVSVHEANSQIFYINQAGKQILGQGLRPEASREQLAETYQIYKAGTNQLYPTEQLPALQALQGKTVTLNDLEIHQQGKIIPLEAKATPIFDDEGNILYALIAFTDITERQQTEKLLAAYNRILETEVAQRTAELTRTNDQLKQEMAERQQAQEALIQSERLFRLLTTLSPVGIFRADASGQTIYANERACQIVGANLENVLGWKWSSYIHPEDLQRVSQTWQQAIAHQSPWQTEYRLLNQEGKISWILAQTDVERDEMGKVIGYVGTLTDISDRKQAELELQQAKAAAEAANRAKSTFLASMSHELRTPLNAIIGFSQLMSRTTNLNPQQQENLRIITSNGEHLLTLVNQVLDFSKIEAERMTLNQTPCDLISLLDDLDSMFQLKAREKALQLVIYSSSNVPQYVQTDEVKLRQILINLLSNAIKFTKEGSVSLKVSTLNTPQNPKPKTQNPTPNTQHPTPNNKQPTTNNKQPTTNNQQPTTNNQQPTLHVEVEDTGPGIAPEEFEQLFQAFSQTKTGAKTRQGTGLGLAISQKFVQLMGGEITVSSQVGKGTTFKFDIPVHSVDTGYIETKQPLRRAIALAPNQPRYRILIADDKQDNRQLLLQLLNPFGFELWEASNGVETVEMWQKYSPHLIFMDVRMPVMDGYEASKRIKATTVGQGTAIVALSGTGLEEIRNTLLAAGCDDFIRKPFQEADILDALQAHIGVRYIYDEPTHASTSTATEAGVVLAEALAAFPADLIANFRRAIVALDAELIDTFIARIREQNEPLANALAAWADNFQYEQLLDLIQVIMKNE